MQNRNVACFKRRGDFIQAPVGAAKNCLVPQAHALGLQLLDSRSNALFFVFIVIEFTQIRQLRTVRHDPR